MRDERDFVDDYVEPSARAKRAEAMGAFGVFVVVIILCAGVVSCEAWQYQECLEVGHSDAYCAARAAGCFDSHRRD
jgi:hypothetical protein